MKVLTKRKKEYISAIKEFIDKNGYSPTFREIGEILNLKSPATIYARLTELKEMGYITFEYGVQRTIRLVDKEVKKEKLLKIINHYGIEHQQRKLEEEVFELQEAIIKFENTEFSENIYDKNIFTKEIEEEIADVMVLLKQFQLKYEIKNEDINRIMQEKVDRQIERMKGE